MESQVVDSQDPIGSKSQPPNSDSGRKRGYQSSGGLTPDDNDGTLYVAPIPRTSTEQEIYALFAVHGNVVDVVFNQDDELDDQRGGCCFVKFAKLEDADRAIAALNDQYTFPGGLAPIKVKFLQGRPGNLFVGCMNKDATEEEIVKCRDNPLEVPIADSKKPRTGGSRPFSDCVQTLKSPIRRISESYSSEEKLDDNDYKPIPECMESDEDCHGPIHLISDDDDDVGDMGGPACRAFLLDEPAHLLFDPAAKSFLQFYNEKQNASFEFVELVAIASQRRPPEKYYTIKAKNSVDGSVETFQFKVEYLDGRERVLECKISDVPYLSDDKLLPPPIRVFESWVLGKARHKTGKMEQSPTST